MFPLPPQCEFTNLHPALYFWGHPGNPRSCKKRGHAHILKPTRDSVSLAVPTLAHFMVTKNRGWSSSSPVLEV